MIRLEIEALDIIKIVNTIGFDYFRHINQIQDSIIKEWLIQFSINT